MTDNQQFTIKDFHGDAKEAVNFVNACWSAQFPDNFTCPQWDRDYFEWQMFAQPDNILLGAYVDDELVGFVFGEPIALRWKQQPIQAMFSTALAADPKRKGAGIAKALAAALAKRMHVRNLAFVYGFAIPGSGSLGPKFWQRSQGAPRSAGIRPWVRPVQSAKLALAAGPYSERLGARVSALFGIHGISPTQSPYIRAFNDQDLEPCLGLVQAAEVDADLRYDWTKARLAHQLKFHDIPATWVYDDGEVRGFVNFHRVLFRGQETFSAGLIDHLIAKDGDRAIEKALMTTALQRIEHDGHILAICPSSACASTQTLWRQKFLPMPVPYDCLFPFMDTDRNVADLKTLKVHLR